MERTVVKFTDFSDWANEHGWIVMHEDDIDGEVFYSYLTPAGNLCVVIKTLAGNAQLEPLEIPEK